MPECAQRNEEGSLDLVAADTQNLYYWTRSGHLPAMQFPQESSLLDARFLSSEPGAAVATVARDGAVTIAAVEGRRERTNRPPERMGLKAARIWVDALGEEDWHVVALTDKYGVTSGPRGAFTASRPAEDLWSASDFLAVCGSTAFWYDASSLTLATLNGLPCVVVERGALSGSGVHFLDPATLVSIRRPLVIHESVMSLTIAAGRWLVAGLLSSGRVKNRIVVWDLDAEDDKPVGGWLQGQGDVYYTTAVAEERDSFQTVQVFRPFDATGAKDFRVCRFSWPSGAVEMLESFENLRLFPVASAAGSK